jgi:phosphoribosylformylglycinamidine synthase subunit PurSL
MTEKKNTIPEPKLKRILVYASGRGSNFTAIADAVRSGELPVEIVALVSNKKNALALDRARERNIPIWLDLTEDEQLARIAAENVDYIVLAGYMKILSPKFIHTLRGTEKHSPILNIHPSLLPEFPGLNSYARAFAAGKTETGITIHWVDEGVDTGEIIAQETFSISDCKNSEEVEKKGLEIENSFYPRILKKIMTTLPTSSFIRFEVYPSAKLSEPRGDRILQDLKQSNPLLAKKITQLQLGEVYWVASPEISGAKLEESLKRAVYDPLLHAPQNSVEGNQNNNERVLTYERSLQPGVTDNRARTLREALEILEKRQLPETRTQSGELFQITVNAPLSAEELNYLGRKLHNPLIQRFSPLPGITRFNAEVIQERFADISISSPPSNLIPLGDFNDEALRAFSAENTLALTLEEMKAIQTHFKSLGRAPSDVEIEIIAQTWSEHCKHKIFQAEIHYENRLASGVVDPASIPSTIKSLFKTTISGTTKETFKPWLVSVFSDNAGIVKFSDESAVCIKVETHNSPSALDPFGGAITGIVGVNRDILGCGLGARPIFNTNVFCVGELERPEGSDLPERILHPKTILEGIRHGVESGGNQSGIPTVNGAIVVDESYIGKPLVFCGTGGIIPLKVAGRVCEDKTVLPGDLIVMAGGRIGKDGIHGATFSSEALTNSSPSSAVQLGDPITQKRMSDFLLEARDLGIYRSLTDNGAGGLSSSVGEMARLSGGAKLDITDAKTKVPGLAPFEIVISESQERMTIALAPENREAFQQLADRRGVELSFVGEFTNTGKFEVISKGKQVANLDLEFLHEGTPKLKMNATWTGPKAPHKVALPGETDAIPSLLRKILARPNLRSKESFIRQYDHEVQGASVIKPLVTPLGAQNHSSPNNGAVQKLSPDSPIGIVIGCGILPEYSRVDAYLMAQASVDEAVRNVLAVGAEYSSTDENAVLALVDNFCWPDPVKDEGFASDLVRACFGLKDAAIALGLPFVSGKDSMKNDYRGKWLSRDRNEPVKVSVNPTLLITALGRLKNTLHARTSEFKKAGDKVYLLGPGHFGLIGSECSRLLGGVFEDSKAPAPDWGVAKRIYDFLGSERSQILRSVHDVSEGGILCAIAEACFARDFGVSLEKDFPSIEAAFGEGFHSFVVSVDESKTAEFETHLSQERVPFTLLGEVTAESQMKTPGWGVSVHELRSLWETPLL